MLTLNILMHYSTSWIYYSALVDEVNFVFSLSSLVTWIVINTLSW